VIAEALRQLPNETIIDAEIVALDESGRPSFNTLQNFGSSKAPIYFYAFDLPMLAGRDLTSLPLQQRRDLLGSKILSKHFRAAIMFVDQRRPVCFKQLNLIDSE
jgi:ATP-dependent DNA ligase